MITVRRAMLGTTLMVVAALALSGCRLIVKTVPLGDAGRPLGSPAASPTPAPSPSGKPTYGKVVMNCDLILSTAHAAELTPSLTPDPSYQPKAGSLGADMQAKGAHVCGWANKAKSASIEVALALGSPAAITLAEAAAAASGVTAPPAGAQAAYFTRVGKVGQAEIFLGSYWIETSSTSFDTAVTASDFYSVMLQDLRSAGG